MKLVFNNQVEISSRDLLALLRKARRRYGGAGSLQLGVIGITQVPACPKT